MKRVFSVSVILLFLMTLAKPLCTLLAYMTSTQLEFRNIPAFVITAAALSVLSPLLLYLFHIRPGRFISVLIPVLLPLSVLNTLFFLFRWEGCYYLLPAWCGGCFALSFRSAVSKTAKSVSVVLTASLLVLLTCAVILVFPFIGLSEDTVVKTVPSPDGTMAAEVVDNNQGALGGATFVNLRYPLQTIDLGFAAFSKSPTRIYEGEWGEADTMQVVWKDADTVEINGTEYSVTTAGQAY